MNADILYATDFPHGTPDGFTRGCHGSHCPAPMACRDVRRRYVGDFGFARQFDAGVPLDVILEREREAAREARRAERAALRVNAPRTKTRRSNQRTGIDRPANTELQQAVLERHAQGMTDIQIGNELGKTRDQVRSVRKWLNLPVNRTPTAADRIREYHAQGMNDTQIAAAMNREREYVAMVRRKAGLPLIPIPRSKISTADVVRLVGEGLTDPEIAERLGTDRATVRKRRHNAKLPVNPIKKTPAKSGVSYSQEAA